MLVLSSTNIVKILMALLVDFYHCCDKFRNRYAVALLVEVEYTLLKAKLTRFAQAYLNVKLVFSHNVATPSVSDLLLRRYEKNVTDTRD